MSNYSIIGDCVPSEESQLSKTMPLISGTYQPPQEEATASDFHFFKFESHPLFLPIPWPFILSVEHASKWAVQSVEDHTQIYLVGVRETAAGLIVRLFDLSADSRSLPAKIVA